MSFAEGQLHPDLATTSSYFLPARSLLSEMKKVIQKSYDGCDRCHAATNFEELAIGDPVPAAAYSPPNPLRCPFCPLRNSL